MSQERKERERNKKSRVLKDQQTGGQRYRKYALEK